jgi:putative mRNA 3-end processing factor
VNLSNFRQPLVSWTDLGLYCAAGDFYIDPTRGVEHAVITHAHSDHARRGSQTYYCESTGVGLLKARLGQRIHVRGIPYRQRMDFGPVRVSFHSAGHILGSSQVRLELDDEVWVVSGDYKRAYDPSCEPFEVVCCDTLITEATLARPPMCGQNTRPWRHIFEWWQQNARSGKK